MYAASYRIGALPGLLYAVKYPSIYIITYSYIIIDIISFSYIVLRPGD